MEDCERLRDLLRQPVKDNVSGRALFEAARPLVTQLIEAYEREKGRDGGEFGRKILEIVEGRVVQELNGRAELSDKVSIASCSVHVVEGACYVDTRLKVDFLL
jgi:hypothetical protein